MAALTRQVERVSSNNVRHLRLSSLPARRVGSYNSHCWRGTVTPNSSLTAAATWLGVSKQARAMTMKHFTSSERAAIGVVSSRLGQGAMSPSEVNCRCLGRDPVQSSLALRLEVALLGLAKAAIGVVQAGRRRLHRLFDDECAFGGGNLLPASPANGCACVVDDGPAELSIPTFSRYGRDGPGLTANHH